MLYVVNIYFLITLLNYKLTFGRQGRHSGQVRPAVDKVSTTKASCLTACTQVGNLRTPKTHHRMNRFKLLISIL